MGVRPIDASRFGEILEQWKKDCLEDNDTQGADIISDVILQLDDMPTLTQPNEGTKDKNVPTNEPLTLEELREMDGEPVYVVPKDKPAHCGGWCGVTVWKCDRYSYVSLLRDADSGWGFEKYGKTWIAYRRPKEEQ